MGHVNNRNLTLEERHQRDLFKEKCANENGYKVIRLVQQEIFMIRKLFGKASGMGRDWLMGRN